MSPNKVRWSAPEVRQLLQLVIIFIASAIETDIYLPAFPDMMKAFAVSEAQIQGLLTWNFLGLCVSALVYGPLSDSFGRRKPLLAALGLFFLGSVLTVCAKDFSWLIVGRILQGLGSGGCFSLGSAVIFDSFSAQKALVALNLLNMIIPVLMAFAPILGGVLNQWFGFKANFLVILIIVTFSLVASVIQFKETLPQENRHPLEFNQLLRNFKKVVGSVPFWQMNLPVCLLFGGYLAFLSITAVFFVVELGVAPKVYPWFQAAVLGGWLIASLSSSYIIQRFGAQRTKGVGILILCFSMVGFESTCLIAPRNPYALTVFIVLYTFGYNWVQTPYFGEIMGLMPKIKGVVGSVVTSFRLLAASLMVAIVGEFYRQSIFSYAWVFLAMTILVLSMIYLREKGRPSNSYPAFTREEITSAVIHS